MQPAVLEPHNALHPLLPSIGIASQPDIAQLKSYIHELEQRLNAAEERAEEAS